MLNNYFKIAIRSLFKQKAYSIINILGLSVGIASCLLIVLFVTDEFSYDNYHNRVDRIYKVALERKYPNHSTFYSVIPHSYADVMARDLPEVEEALHVGGPVNNVIVTYRTPAAELVQFEENFMLAADSNFFNVFNIKMLKGDPAKALHTLNDVVISEATTRRYFGADEPIGKVFQFFGQDFVVTGVTENVPENTHFKFDFLFKWDAQFFAGNRNENFVTFSAHTYLVAKPGIDRASLEGKFPQLVDTYAAAQIERDLGKSWADYKKEGNGYRYFLQPVTSIHLDPTNIEFKLKPVGGNINNIYFLISVAVLIVAIACINFMNLATARSAERAREVGVRKTMGSAKTQLVYQFLIESMIISFVATFIGVVLVQLVLPSFNELAHKVLLFKFSLIITVGLVVLALVVGLMAGSYPAFVLSGFNPVVVMKGNFSGSAQGAWLRNGLVVFQFMISIVLIVGTLVVSDQMDYMQKKSLGYYRDQVLVIDRTFALRDKVGAFRDEMKALSNVAGVGISTAMLGDARDYFGAQYQPQGSSEILTTKTMFIDDYFSNTVGFEFVEGKGFSEETNDSLSIILNETAVKTMELGADPIGQKLNLVQRGANGNAMVPFTIIGVIKDFNFQSLRDQITPLTLQSTERGGFARFLYVRVPSGDIASVLSTAESRWKEMIGLTRREGEAAEFPFKYTYLDQNLRANYEEEQRARTLFTIFSALAISIACVGLFGLAAYTATLRTKEIGVRKVMGASVVSVIFLLTRDFTKLILVAIVLAVPLGWYMMTNWLDNFAYRTSIGVGTFLLAGGVALVISWLTVSYQSIKAAIRNPVRSLRSE